MLKPLPPKVSRTMGTRFVMPKKPYTTEGMPAMSDTMGISTLRRPVGQKRARYTPPKMPMGPPMIKAPAVT